MATIQHTPPAMTYGAFVFKIKLLRPGAKDESRRYGFAGDLRNRNVFVGLYERTSQVFDLKLHEFHLVFHDVQGMPRRIATFQDFLEHVCAPTLDTEARTACKRDDKNRIVLTFRVCLTQASQAQPLLHPVGNPSTTVVDTVNSVPPPDVSTIGLEQRASSVEAQAQPERRPEPEPARAAAVATPEDAASTAPTPVTTTPLDTPVPATSPRASSYHPYYALRPHPFPNMSPAPAPSSPRGRWAPPVPASSFAGRPDVLYCTSAQRSPGPRRDHWNRRDHLIRPNPHHHPHAHAHRPTLGTSSASRTPGYSPVYTVPAPVAAYSFGDRPAETSTVTETSIDACSGLPFLRPAETGSVNDTIVPVELESSTATEAEAVGESAMPDPAQRSEQQHSPTATSSENDAQAMEEDPWSGIKTMLKTFVRDVNRHFAENLGDVAHELVLSLDSASSSLSSPHQHSTTRAADTIPQKDEHEGAIHHTVYCDRCVKTIIGTRRKCGSCPNYDLCNACFPNRHYFHPSTHDFAVVAPPGLPLAMPVPQRMPKANPSSMIFKPIHNAICDVCDQTIRGVRHKCAECDDYDLCENCIEKASTVHHDAHVFVAINHPTVPVRLLMEQAAAIRLATLACTPSQEPHKAEQEEAEEGEGEEEEEEKPEHPANCDICEESIRGVRFKCVRCPDFDLCEVCMAQVDHLHPLHDFVEIADPESFVSKTQPGDFVVHAHVSCDGCRKSPIVGTRYKCAHPDCPDFDLCAACEAAPIALHPRSHPLLKLREPIDRVIVGHYVEEQWRGRDGAPEPVIAPVVDEAPSTVEPLGPSTVASEREVDAADESEQANEDVFADAPPVKSPAEVEAQVNHEPVNVDGSEAVAAVALLDAHFVSDITFADRAIVPAGGRFCKVWSITNSGAHAWPAGVQIVNVGGFSKRATYRGETLVRSAQPGDTVEIEVEFEAPEAEGRHVDYWRLADAEGALFGDRLWIDITVATDEEALRESGSLSASMIAPSLNAGGQTLAPSSRSRTTLSSASSSSLVPTVIEPGTESDADVEVGTTSDFESVREDTTVYDEDDEQDEPSEDDSDDGLSDLESVSDDGSFVVLSGSEGEAEESDEEWETSGRL